MLAGSSNPAQLVKLVAVAKSWLFLNINYCQAAHCHQPGLVEGKAATSCCSSSLPDSNNPAQLPNKWRCQVVVANQTYLQLNNTLPPTWAIRGLSNSFLMFFFPRCQNTNLHRQLISTGPLPLRCQTITGNWLELKFATTNLDRVKQCCQSDRCHQALTTSDLNRQPITIRQLPIKLPFWCTFMQAATCQRFCPQ